MPALLPPPRARRTRGSLGVRSHHPERARVSGSGDVERGAVRRVGRRDVAVAAAGGSLTRAQRRPAEPTEHLARRLHRVRPRGTHQRHRPGGVRSPRASPATRSGRVGSLEFAPRLSLMLRPFVAHADLWPAVSWMAAGFVTEGDVDQVAKGRLKFLAEARREQTFRAAFQRRLRRGAQPGLPPDAAAGQTPRSRHPRPRPRSHAPRSAGVTASHLTARGTGVDHRSGAARRMCWPTDLIALAHLSPTDRLCADGRTKHAGAVGADQHVLGAVGELLELFWGPTGLGARPARPRLPRVYSFCSLAITGSQPVRRRRGAARSNTHTGSATRGLDRGVGLPELVHQAAGRRPRAVGAEGETDGQVGLGYGAWLGAEPGRAAPWATVLRLLEED